jgi:hypothetical protein
LSRKAKFYQMKTLNYLPALAAGLALAATSARAQNLQTADAQSPNRFGLNYRLGLNLKVNFHGLGGFGQPLRLTPNGDPFNYSDGYVYQDINHGLGGQTWYWGYAAAPAPYKQYTLGDPSVIFHQFSSQPNANSNDNDATPQSNFELTYNRELYRGKNWRAGLEAAAGYGRVSVNDSRPMAADLAVASDAYAVPIDPMTGYGITTFANYPGPHYGDSVGPNALLGDTPAHLPAQILPGGALISGSRQFDADVFGFRLGPYVELPLSDTVSLNFSGGLAVAFINSDFSFHETVTVAGVGSQTHSGSGSHSDWLPGGYVAATCSVALSQRWALLAGAQFEDVGKYSQFVNGKQAVLDLTRAVFVTVGVSYVF